jgi:hypothetical protein
MERKREVSNKEGRKQEVKGDQGELDVLGGLKPQTPTRDLRATSSGRNFFRDAIDAWTSVISNRPLRLRDVHKDWLNLGLIQPDEPIRRVAFCTSRDPSLIVPHRAHLGPEQSSG